MAARDQPVSKLPFPRRDLRQATLVIPDTGEHIHRAFTLRDPRIFAARDSANTGAANGHGTGSDQNQAQQSKAVSASPSWRARTARFVGDKTSAAKSWAVDFLTSRNGQGVLKCSLAYFLATMTVFAQWFERILGVGDSKHLVANIIIWFHPARSSGNMDYGILLAIIAFTYGAGVAYGSMGTVTYFRTLGLIEYGQAIILLVFCGGGFGLLAWTKQRYHDLLINVSCSVAALPIVTTLTKDRATQDGYFHHATISQVLRMMVVAITLSVLIGLFVLPIFGRRDLHENLVKATRAYADLLAGITASFLTGSEQDSKHPAILEATEKFNSAYNALDQNLIDARNEHYVRGTERQYQIEARLVRAMKGLAQDLGGFRSAAAIQFHLIARDVNTQSNEGNMDDNNAESTILDEFPSDSPSSMHHESSQPDPGPEDVKSENSAAMASIDRSAMNSVGDDTLSHVAEQSTSKAASSSDSSSAPSTPTLRNSRPSKSLIKPEGLSAASSGHVFATFIEHLGPPMKSLAYTLKEILSDLSIGPDQPFANERHPHFRSSLDDAIKMFESARKEALIRVYQSKEVTLAKAVAVTADFEEVAASCGHFSSSLQDLAEKVLQYLDTLTDLEQEVKRHDKSRSWNWMLFWRPNKVELSDDHVAGGPLDGREHQDTEFLADIPSLGTRRYYQHLRNEDMPEGRRTLRYRLWLASRFCRRDDIKFAVKVGIGAVILAMFAYLPSTQEFFWAWRLEWALATYIFVCAMTVGAAYSTVMNRVKGTFIGGVLAVFVWIICRGNPIALAFCGWIVSLVAFHIMLVQEKGPMGRFILLTYNLSVLYSYSLTIKDSRDDEDNSDEGGSEPAIFSIVFHRLGAVLVGILLGLIVTQLIWPVSARRKLRSGLSLLWLRMALIWKRSPFSLLLEEEEFAQTYPAYMRIGEEVKLREFADMLDVQRKGAEAEFMLRGPFPSASYDVLLKCTGRMLDGFHALSVLVSKDAKASHGEIEMLRFTLDESDQLAKRISHLFSVLASSVKLEYPLNDALPNIEHTRERFLLRLFQFGQDPTRAAMAVDEDYELLYAYALVTKQIATEIDTCCKEVEKLYGVLNEDLLKLQ